ncbi:DUF2064 domain-containing protein [Nocardioides sp. TRM66260-LWL]|uniref:TIGR04282 family arsenosugar biosynthesis glycosyltransferase n=1 Tax=Nocardioides sp. TRM66260-LWL TaxID=2874478 RepID=UPI001CC4A5C1|nr:DUF2064 domain-containing protein [Nocardioides sp. TRM66260-LWL]MBZ5735522.1 DUF2064 domain-containing protein [Nocardioides sp. TRM66260-LWL]
MSAPTALVMAKVPVPGRVKTRLAADLPGSSGQAHEAAAALAAAALLDTLDAVAAWAPPGRRVVALDADPADPAAGPHAGALVEALDGWRVVPQGEGGLDERLARAHARVDGAVLQIGMDTPHVTPALLDAVAAGLDDADAVVAPADDGGWWALALRSGRDGRALHGVPMSTDTTGEATVAALAALGLRVGSAPVLEDADTLAAARRIAAAAPDTRFARLLERLEAGLPAGEAALR